MTQDQIDKLYAVINKPSDPVPDKILEAVKVLAELMLAQAGVI